ncbi:polysaccharide biosynthesis tyrosine autokinase [Roseiconus lacunae]|uniref:P-loop NTPase n=1 Tax=Roseiconus lacunae TaxID=2605694 RepID=A0ABT7PDK9_9BACT|nr:polysaccharide biosynthesis tyrosine autokinase [Roseiconus lacunae]MDM4014567.1 P-loop NTPase [Roseiconus lacunae]
MIAPVTEEKQFSLPPSWNTSDVVPTDNDVAQLDPKDFLHTLRRKGVLAAMIGFPIGVAVAIAVFTSLPEKYVASAILRLSATETNLVFDGAEPVDFEIFQGTQREMVQTHMVMTAALRNQALSDSSVLHEERPIEWMLDNISVTTPKDTEIMKISTVAPLEANPIAIVNSTVEAYLNEVVNREKSLRLSKLTGIEKVLDEKLKQSVRQRNDLKNLVEQFGTGDSATLAIKQQMLVQELGYVRRELIKHQSEKLAMQGQLTALRASLSTLRREGRGDALAEPDDELADGRRPGEDLPSEETVSQEPTESWLEESEIDRLIAQDRIYNELVRDKMSSFRAQTEAEAAFRSDAKSPYRQVQAEIDKALNERREQIIEEALAVAPIRERARMHLAKKETEERVAQLEAQLPVTTELLAQLTQEESRLMQEFRKVGNSSIEVEMERAELAQLDRVIESIGRQCEELRVELESRPRVEKIQSAEELQPAGFLKRVGMSGASGMLAFLVPFGLILGLDFAQRRVGCAGGLDGKTGIPVVGTLPVIPRSALKNIGNTKSRKGQQWQNRLHEAAKRVGATMIGTYDSRDADCLVLLVTSTVRGEGKSTVAAQLARGLASKSRSVILCDFDLRRPRQHLMFGADNQIGLSEILREEVEVETAILESTIPGLKIVSAGQCNSKTIDSLVEGNAGPLLSELRSHADVIVIDAGPILTSADVGYLCPHVDRILFAARRDVSRIPSMHRALDAIPAWEHQIAGTVLIDKCDDRADASF